MPSEVDWKILHQGPMLSVFSYSKFSECFTPIGNKEFRRCEAKIEESEKQPAVTRREGHLWLEPLVQYI